MNELVNVKIENKDGVLFVSSRDIAEQLGKEHSKVIRSLESILTEPNVASLIILSEYKDRKGEMRKEYLLTKDGFTLYMFNIQGYNDFKMAYINRFNEMEKEIQSLTLPSYQIANPIERAKRWIEEEEVRQLQAKQLTEQKPLVNFANTIANSNDCIDIGTFAKLLNEQGIKMGRNKLFKKLREMKILMNNNKPYQSYIDKNYFEIREYSVKTLYGDKLNTQTLLTGKGQIYIAKKLKEIKESKSNAISSQKR